MMNIRKKKNSSETGAKKLTLPAKGPGCSFSGMIMPISNPDRRFAYRQVSSQPAEVSRFSVGDIEVDTVAVPHDAEEPVAYSIRHNGIKVTQLTDLGWIPDHVSDSLKGTDVLILESNHDLDMLRMGPYPWSLKERLMGRRGHLSNAAVARFLGGAWDGRARHIVLAHLSSKNNHPELAREVALHALRERGSETRLSLASQDAPGPILEVG